MGKHDNDSNASAWTVSNPGRDAERALLGCVFRDPTKFAEQPGLLVTGHFGEPALRCLAKIVHEIHDEGEEPDIVSVAGRVPGPKVQAWFRGNVADFCIELQNLVPSAAKLARLLPASSR